jgi:hypothetical protein
VTILVGESEKSYRYPLSILQTWSKYFDTMFATSMREKKEKKVILRDIEPFLWEEMIDFVGVPRNARCMDIDHVMYLAPAYDKYHFAGGFHLCDQVVEDYFQRMLQELKMNNERVHNLHQSIEVILLADEIDLVYGRDKGIEYFGIILNSPFYFDERCLNEDKLKALIPIILKFKEKLLIPEFFEGLTAEEIVLNPLFPRLYIRKMELLESNSRLNDALAEIRSMKK